MRERLKKWGIKLFVTKYLIVRNEIVLWQLFYVNRTDTKFILASSELLTKVKLFDGLIFSKILKNGYQSNAFWTWLLIKILINRNGHKYKYKRIKATEITHVNELER